MGKSSKTKYYQNLAQEKLGKAEYLYAGNLEGNWDAEIIILCYHALLYYVFAQGYNDFSALPDSSSKSDFMRVESIYLELQEPFLSFNPFRVGEAISITRRYLNKIEKHIKDH